MKKLIDYFKDDNRTIFFLIISAISLIVSFFNIGDLKFNAAWIAIILCGVPIIKGAIEGLVTEFDIKADVLVSIALVASVVIGEIFAAGEVAFIMSLGALLEEMTVAKSRAGIEKLVHLTPRTARVVKDGTEKIIPAEEVQVGDIVRVIAGEAVAVDGIIISGQTSIDQSVVTGESLPIDKSAGDEVFSGTVNQFGTFDMEATKVGENSSLQRMIKLVESADASKAKIVGIADRWATWIVVIALVSAVGTWFVTGEIIRSVTILVVFCPCALVLATPTAIMASIGNAAKHGILVVEGDALERLSQVRKIAFDKTGTLTHGKPDVVDVVSFDESISSEKLLELTASAEQRSEHPIGKSIVSHFKKSSNKILPDAVEFTLYPGSGVKSVISGDTVFVGKLNLMTENSVKMSEEMIIKTDQYLNDGCTVIYVALNNKPAGFVALSDTLRKESADVVRKLKQNNVESMLLTGDNSKAALHIAETVGIENVRYECLPEDKINAIDNCHLENEMVCMVGDGINDAPALKKSFVGVAMGGIGSDIAIDSADIVLVGDDIKFIPYLFMLSKKTMNTIKWNLALSMLLNFAAIVLAMRGDLGPVLGALVHNVGSVFVIINSALLLNFKTKQSDEKLADLSLSKCSEII